MKIRSIVKCCLTPNERQQLHERLQTDLQRFRKIDECKQKIESYYEKRMEAVKAQAEHKKFLLDVEHAKQLKVIELETLFHSSFLYEEKYGYRPRQDYDYEPKKIQVNLMNCDDDKEQDNTPTTIRVDEGSVTNVYNILMAYVVFHILLIASIFVIK